MPDPPERDEAAPGAKRVLEAGARFDGLVVLHGAARIDGQVRGEVVGAERLEIGESAELDGTIESREIVVAGRVEGALRATRRLELGRTARVRGAIDTPRLAAADGARVDGEWSVGGPGTTSGGA